MMKNYNSDWINRVWESLDFLLGKHPESLFYHMITSEVRKEGVIP